MNILILATYPIDTPLHGGQHRLYNIVRAYRTTGHSVALAGVLGSDSYTASSGFEPYPGIEPLTKHIENPFLMDDWAIGELFSENVQYFNALANNIKNIPDVIHVEQPWLYAFAKRYVETNADHSIKIIYGSQNIEHQLKYDIVKTYLGENAASSARAKVLKCELEAITGANGICCVSEGDLEWTKAHSALATKCVLAPNGVSPRPTTINGLIEANKISGHHKFSLYCASAHPPNISGFFDIFHGGVGCIAPDETIIIAGSAGQSITTDQRFNRVAGLSRACKSAGIVSETCLQGLLDTAHTIILPITHGGGTNLKTAEALWAGKHIVATPIAMRGFEQFSSSIGVAVESEPSRFLSAMRNSMASPPNILSDKDREERRVVLWEETLNSLVSNISIF